MASRQQMAQLRKIPGALLHAHRGPRPLLRPRLATACSSHKALSRWESTTGAAWESPKPTLQTAEFYRLPDLFPVNESFTKRHIGPDDQGVQEMLQALSPPVKSLEEFVEQVIPADIRSTRELFVTEGKQSESETMSREGLQEWEVQKIAQDIAGAPNKSERYFIGEGYYGTLVPEVIKRNVLESPAWYTSYTPYQPEISQGRLESLLNFQTLVTDLTALPVANASLLDEGTAAAEALAISLNSLPSSRQTLEGKTFVVSNSTNPATIKVLCGRAEALGVNVLITEVNESTLANLEELGNKLVGVLLQYPDRYGSAIDFRSIADAVHKQGALLSVGTDLLALTLLTPPGELGADIAFGTSQRFGVPFGSGGPHAAFFAVQDKLKRKMPGRLVGVSKDRLGGRALRLALQTREQHIRREKATSNVCTAQALLANMAAFYAVYHGPEGLKRIAERCNLAARVVWGAATRYGYEAQEPVFDRVTIGCPGMADKLYHFARDSGIYIRPVGDNKVTLSMDETVTEEDLTRLVRLLDQFRFHIIKQSTDTGEDYSSVVRSVLEEQAVKTANIPKPLKRTSPYLTHPVFNSHHSETEMLRYIHHLQSKDLSLVHSMIPLGSCTMKLNGSAEMSLITLPGFANVHPGRLKKNIKSQPMYTIIYELEEQLKSITGMDGVSLQPNSGAQGEYAGLRIIRSYLDSQRGPEDPVRDICLIPVSAHGTNPASAAMAGMRVVPIKCDTKTGNLDLEDLRAKCEQHSKQIGAIMITYPSTFGVFEPQIKEVCNIIHSHGGQVYMDGANMNAQIGLCSPGEIGADVCHLNLHKTFCIPHGGGGPGVGPVCVKKHLGPHLPITTLHNYPNHQTTQVTSAPFGSAGILPISWSYIALMGAAGLKKATQVGLLNANYLLAKLKPHYSILYTNEHGRCAHEFILDVRPFQATAGIEAIDIAKRLQDYGFHAPTMSWPVANTLMIEPTESESKEELDRFVDALVSIREEIREVEEGKAPRQGNVLKMAPHPMVDIIGGDGEEGSQWDRPYSRTKAAYPLPWLREKKFWPSVARINDTYGDTHLFCTCPPVEDTTGGNLSSVQTSQ
ncbi:glycine cleavage system P-protein-domain-containing protein [Triangularia verruculosa]|uniref:Glycine cleavage system P protein n=1 Tax=Triangularia verruculosa TaxID=2587418 RepID=A0AAN6XI37_9PEZI|nr:glycine cleavage system P-protein-domain-containing protein [Triangularia verruculosa]